MKLGDKIYHEGTKTRRESREELTKARRHGGALDGLHPSATDAKEEKELGWVVRSTRVIAFSGSRVQNARWQNDFHSSSAPLCLRASVVASDVSHSSPAFAIAAAIWMCGSFRKAGRSGKMGR